MKNSRKFYFIGLIGSGLMCMTLTYQNFTPKIESLSMPEDHYESATNAFKSAMSASEQDHVARRLALKLEEEEKDKDAALRKKRSINSITVESKSSGLFDADGHQSY